MNTGQWLQQATTLLNSAGIETARLDALVLLEDVLGVDRARLLAEPEMVVGAAEAAKLEKLLGRRVAHEPLAYIRGHSEFYGRDFVISPAVLVPRPESETMIELLGELSATRELVKNNSSALRLADVGAGSGALGITAALEFPAATNIAVDLLEIDYSVAAVAQINVDKFTIEARVIVSDLLAQSSQDYDMLLCNLPYVPDNHKINQAAAHEPQLALFGGSDGLDLYRRLFSQVGGLPKQPLFILTEALPEQHTMLREIAEPIGYENTETEGFIQVFKRTEERLP